MFAGKKILIVEDSRTIKLQIKMILEKEGAILAEAGTEWGMFSKIDEYGKIADLIIMDLVLGNDDGLKLIEKIRSNPSYENIPVMIITEKVDVDTILEAKNLGVKSYLKKPIKRAELLGRINNILGTADSKDSTIPDENPQ